VSLAISCFEEASVVAVSGEHVFRHCFFAQSCQCQARCMKTKGCHSVRPMSLNEQRRKTAQVLSRGRGTTIRHLLPNSYTPPAHTYQAHTHPPHTTPASNMAINTAISMATNTNRSELTMTIIFGCLATVLALAGIIVACVQYRTYNRTSDSTSSPSSLEAGLPLTPIIPSGQPQKQGDSEPASKSDKVEVSSTLSSSDTTRA
jgi:hypothetical protein